MTKVVFLSLGLVFLLTSVPHNAGAQTNDTDIAISRAVQDQANTIVLRQKLEDAKAAAGRGDLARAAKLYEDALGVAQQIGSGIDVETAQTISGLASTRLALARQAQSRGDLREADAQVSRVLKVDPKNADAIAFKRQNDEMFVAMRGKMPDTATLERRDAADKEKIQADTLVQDGKVLYESGKLEEAEARLDEALKLDPDNTGAYYYYQLIKAARYDRDEHKATTASQDAMVKVESAFNSVIPSLLPKPNPYATNNLIYTGPGRQVIISKLDRIRLDSISYDPPVPLKEVLNDLKQKIKARDPEKKGVNFLIDNNVDNSDASLAAGAAAAGPGGATQIDPNTGQPLVAAPAAPAEAVDIGSYLINLSELDDVRLDDVLQAICLVADHPIKYSILDYGVVFSAKGPAQVQLSERTFKVDPNTFYSGLESVSSASFGSVNNSSSSGGGGGGGSSGGGSSGGGGGGGSGNNSGGTVIAVVNASPGAGSLRSTGSGSGGGGGGGGGNATSGVDPLSGVGGGAGAGGAGTGGGGGGVTGGQGGLRYLTTVNLASDVSSAARAFFTTLGVNMAVPPGKSVAFNDKLGLLFVRATDQDLDTIERVIQALNTVSPQVHIKSRFIEVSQSDNKALGFDWFLGQFNVGSKIVGTGGTSPSLTVPASAANPLGAFPGNTAASVIAGAATDQQIGNLVTANSGIPALATFTGILTDPNFRVVLHALDQRGGTETLGEPEVTTTSGRQAQMRATKIINVVSGFGFDNGTGANGATAGTAGGTTGGTVVNQAGAASITPFTQQVETGPILDIVPYVLSDGYTISMALIPSDTEFNGYDTITATEIPGFNPGAALAGIANGTTLPVALPLFTVRQVVTTVNVWDNQTVVLGGLITSSVQSTKDKVPFLGDLPGVGRLFQSQSKTEAKDNLMVFVTPTIVDPAGNRLHSDDQLPFAQAAVPAQPAFPTQVMPPDDSSSVTK